MTAARCERPAPATRVKSPPISTLPPGAIASARTEPLVLTRHALGLPAANPTAAAFVRGFPPTAVNKPPRYARRLATRIASTRPATLGFHAVSLPVVALMAAALWRVTASGDPSAVPAGRIELNWPPR